MFDIIKDKYYAAQFAEKAFSDALKKHYGSYAVYARYYYAHKHSEMQMVAEAYQAVKDELHNALNSARQVVHESIQ